MSRRMSTAGDGLSASFEPESAQAHSAIDSMDDAQALDARRAELLKELRESMSRSLVHAVKGFEEKAARLVPLGARGLADGAKVMEERATELLNRAENEVSGILGTSLGLACGSRRRLVFFL